MEPAERKLHTLMQRVSTIRNDKAAKRKETQKQRRWAHNLILGVHRVNRESWLLGPKPCVSNARPDPCAPDSKHAKALYQRDARDENRSEIPHP